MMNVCKQLREALAGGPVNPRRKVLSEAQYSLPASSNMAVMDLYALYALWFTEGSGKEAYGYEQTAFLHGRKTRIDRTFEECLAVYADTLLTECRNAVEDEADNAFDEHLIDQRKLLKWAREGGYEKRLLAAYNDGVGMSWWANFGYNEVIDMFDQDFWKEDAPLYGGAKWAEITRALRALDAAYRRGDSVKLMGALDAVMDLEHNTGALAGKLRRAKVDKKTLDLRSQFKSPADFLPYVSGQVSKLIRP